MHDVDLINDSVFSLIVPDLFKTLIQPSWIVRWVQGMSRQIGGQALARARRQAVSVPVRVRRAGDFVVAARDVSATGIGITAPTPIAVGTVLDLSMFAPGRRWAGQVSVARCVARPSRAGFDTWLLGLHFESEQTAAEIDSFWYADVAA